MKTPDGAGRSLDFGGAPIADHNNHFTLVAESACQRRAAGEIAARRRCASPTSAPRAVRTAWLPRGSGGRPRQAKAGAEAEGGEQAVRAPEDPAG